MSGADERLDWGAATDIGNVRALNEDAFVALPPLFAVADGMGGHAAGEVAADLALYVLRGLIERSNVGGTDIVAAIDDANAAIVDRALTQETTRGMGTTLSGICLGTVGSAAHWFVFNVGDSRVYRYVGGVLEQLTTDHSEVEELVAAGQLTHDEARRHPNRNIITRSLGTDPAPTPDLWVIPFQEGETFLICSDGLTTELEDDEVRAVLKGGWSAQQMADDLCARALEAGGRDNISVVIVRMLGNNASEIDVATAPRTGLVDAQ